VGVLTLGATVVTARIPELSASANPLDIADRFPVWIAQDNVTRQTTLADLRQFILTGSAQVLNPTLNGNSIVITIGASDDGNDHVDIPALAGKTFILRKNGYGTLKPQVQFDWLSTGGFKYLIPGDVVNTGEQFELEIITPNAAGPGQTATTGSFITGEVIVSSSLSLNAANHANKLIQCRPVAAGLKITLSKVEDFPDNAVIPFESSIAQNYETEIATQAGQNIYFNGASVSSMYIRQGESLWLYRKSDGYYVISCSESMRTVGHVSEGYKAGSNQLKFEGQILSRSLYQRLFKYASSLGASYIDDALWNTDEVTVGTGDAARIIERPYRGCFSSGDGTSTFRLPDFRNVATRTLKGSADDERYYNNAGGYQKDEFKEHNHKWNTAPSNDSLGGTGYVASSNGGGGGANGDLHSIIEKAGGIETRMENIGLYKLINI